MSVINRTASSLGRRDDVPNKELAKELAETNNAGEIRELIENLKNKDRNIRSDCIKVLYEIGYIAPELIAEYVKEFLRLLKSKNNRLVWGSMIALSTIAEIKASELYKHRKEIKQAIEKGSVITVDSGIRALSITASKSREHQVELFPYLLEHLAACRPKDFPQYSEKILAAVNAENKMAFIGAINSRMKGMNSSQIKRLKKVVGEAEKR